MDQIKQIRETDKTDNNDITKNYMTSLYTGRQNNNYILSSTV